MAYTPLMPLRRKSKTKARIRPYCLVSHIHREPEAGGGNERCGGGFGGGGGGVTETAEATHGTEGR